MKKQTICLNMIVKNESRVIRRCLSSIKNIIDTWVIVDTGSNDGTPTLIRDFLRDIPGELVERPWVNFSHNRNEALSLARGKADYILFIDADDSLQFSESFVMPNLEKDCYYVTMQIPNERETSNMMVLLIKDIPDFRWVGAIHEALYCETNKSTEILRGVVNRYNHDGDRSRDSERYEKDIKILKNELAKDPNNTRYVFYLAKAYLGLGDWRSALTIFEKRANMNEGSPDEKFYSLYLIGCLQKTLGMEPPVFIERLCTAYQTDPARVEPLYEITNYFIQTENYFLGSLIAKYAVSIPCQPQKLFVIPWQYDPGVKDQLNLCRGYLPASCSAISPIL